MSKLNKIRKNLLKVQVIWGLLMMIYFLLGGKSCAEGNVSKDADTIVETTIVDTVTYVDTIHWTDTNIVEISLIVNEPVRMNVDAYSDTAVTDDLFEDINIYSDSAVTDDVSIYWADTVQGRLVGKYMSYKLHLPSQIVKTSAVTKTVTQTTTSPQHHKFYLDINIGNKDKCIGGIFINKNDKMLFGYNYDFYTESHNIKLGYKLWESK